MLKLIYNVVQDGGIGSIKYPLLSDFTKTIAKSYGVLIESSGIALRGLFIIDDKGIIRHTSVNDLPVGRSVDEVLRLVKAFQFNDKHGEGKLSVKNYHFNLLKAFFKKIFIFFHN